MSKRFSIPQKNGYYFVQYRRLNWWCPWLPCQIKRRWTPDRRSTYKVSVILMPWGEAVTFTVKEMRSRWKDAKFVPMKMPSSTAAKKHNEKIANGVLLSAR